MAQTLYIHILIHSRVRGEGKMQTRNEKSTCHAQQISKQIKRRRRKRKKRHQHQQKQQQIAQNSLLQLATVSIHKIYVIRCVFTQHRFASCQHSNPFREMLMPEHIRCA